MNLRFNTWGYRDYVTAGAVGLALGGMFAMPLDVFAAKGHWSEQVQYYSNATLQAWEGASSANKGQHNIGEAFEVRRAGINAWSDNNMFWGSTFFRYRVFGQNLNPGESTANLIRTGGAGNDHYFGWNDNININLKAGITYNGTYTLEYRYSYQDNDGVAYTGYFYPTFSIIGTNYIVTNTSGTVEQNVFNGGAATLVGTGAHLLKQGNSTLELNANNTYSGGTYIDAGIVRLLAGGIPGSGLIYLGSGFFPALSAELQLQPAAGGVSLTNSITVAEISGGSSRTIASLNTSGENILRGPVALTDDSLLRLFMPSGSGLLLLTNVISGNEGIWVDAEGGTIAFLGNNTYSGGTFIDRGTVLLSNHNNAAGSGTLFISGDAANATNATLLIAGGRTIPNQIIARPVKLDTSATIRKNSDGDTEMTGRLHLWANDQGGQRPTRIINSGAGTFTFSGDINLASPDTDNRSLFVENAVLFSGAITNPGARGLVVRGASGQPTFDGTIEANIFQDSGNATIGPNATFDDGTIYQLGTTDNPSEITNNATLSFSTGDRTYDLSIAAGFYNVGASPGTRQFNFSHGSGLITLLGTVNIGAGATNAGHYLVMSNAQDVVVQGNLSGTGGIHKIGSGLMTLDGTATYASETRIENGSLRLGSSTAVGAAEIILGFPTTGNNVNLFVAAGATLATPVDVRAGAGNRVIGMNESSGLATLNAPIALSNNLIFDVPGEATLVSDDNISGPHSIEKIGTGWLVFRGANSYSGLTAINQGAISIEHANALGGTGSGTDVADGAALEIRGGITTAAEPLTLHGAGRTASPGGALRNTADNNNFAGPVTLALSASIGVDHAVDTLTLSGVVDGTAARNLSKIGPGTLSLTANNTFLGEVRINDGVVSVPSINSTASAAQPLGQRTTTPVIRFINTDTTGTLRYTGDADATLSKGVGFGVGSAAAYGAIDITQAARTLTITEPVISVANANHRFYKTGPGRLTLDAANTYQGRTIIQQGPLRATQAGSLGTNTDTDNHATFVESGGALEVIGGITLTERIYLAGTGIAAGGALRNISGANTMSGRFFLADHARINADAGTLTLNHATAITDVYGLTFGGAGQIDMSTVIGTGAGTVTKDGSGLTRLLANNTYSGNTTVEAGTLQIGSGTAGSISSSSALQINAGATSVISRSDAWTYSGTISGAGQLRKREAGTITLSGNSPTFSGGVWHEPDSGLLNIGHTSALGTGPYTIQGENNSFDNVTAGPLTSANGFVLAGSPSFVGSDQLTFTGPVLITGANRSITVITNNLILNGVISQDGSSRALNKLGHSGWLTLNGNNTHSGGTRLDQGRINIGHANALGSGTFRVALAEFDNTTGAPLTIGNFFLFNGTPIFVGTDNLTITGNASLGDADRDIHVLANTLRFNGVLSESSGSRRLRKYSPGALSLMGVNTYGGGTVLAGGRLNIGHWNALGSGTFTIDPSPTPVVFDNIYGAPLIANPVTNAVTINGNSLFAGTHEMAFNGPVTLAGNHTLSVTGAPLWVVGVLGQSGGDRSLVKEGQGTLILVNTNNTFAGTLTISQGVVRIYSTNSLGAVDGGTIVRAGATLEMANAARTDSEPLSLAGMGVTNGGALRNLQEGAYYNGLITMAADSRINSASGELRVRGGVIGNNYDLFLGGGGHIRFENAPVTGDTTRLIVDIAGQVRLFRDNTFGGGIIISNGVVTADPTSPSGDLRLGAVPASFDPDYFYINGGGFRPLNTLATHANRGFTIGPNGMTIDTPGSLNTINGAITGSGDFIKIGPAALTLSAVSDYTGETFVNEGAIVMSGTATNSDFTVAAGATLRGAGAVRDALIYGRVNAGNATNGVGVLSVNELRLENNSEMIVDITAITGTPGVHWDLIAAESDVYVNATSSDPITLRIRGNPGDFYPWLGYTNVIVTGASIVGFAANKFAVDWSGFTPDMFGGSFEVAQIGDTIVIRNNPVPFPTATNGVFGAGGFVTDAQIRSGVFDVVMQFYSAAGMSNNATMPNFDLITPAGVVILTNHVFSSITYLDNGRTQIASNTSHAGAAYAVTMLGTYTSRYDAVTSNGVIRTNVDTYENGDPITFQVIDDDTAPPVFSGFNISGYHPRDTAFAVVGQVQDAGSGIIADGANTNRPHFRVFRSDGSLALGTTFFTNSVSSNGDAQGSPATLTYAIPASVFNCAGVYTVRVFAADADDDRPNDGSFGQTNYALTVIAPYGLPFVEPFEADYVEPVVTGVLNCQRGWTSGTNAVVQTAVRHQGNQALRLQADTASHSFTGTFTNVTFSFYGILLPENDDDVTVTNGSAVFYINTNNTVTVLDGTNKSALAVGVNPAIWNFFVINLNYQAQTWTLAVNGTNLVNTFSFLGAPNPDLITMTFQTRSTNEYAYIDTINIRPDPYTDAYVTNHVAGLANTVTDGQMVSGQFSMAIDFWSGDGMTNNAGYPYYDLLHPNGTVILTGRTFSSFSYHDSGRGLRASNSSHISFFHPVLGVYTARWSAITFNGMITTGVEVWSNGTPLAFNVIDDDVVGPVHSGFSIHGTTHEMENLGAGLILTGMVQDVGSGIIADAANTNRPFFVLYRPDGSVAMNTTFFTNSVQGQSAMVSRVVIDAGQSTFLTAGNWNNLTNHAAGTTLANLVATNGQATTISLSIANAFFSNNANGTTTPGPNAAYPANATRDSLYGQNGATSNAVLVLSNLNAHATYTFRFFASRMSAGGDNREAEYSVQGASTNIVYLDASENTNNVAVTTAIAPRADGTIRISVRKGPANNNASGFYYLGVIDMDIEVPVPAQTTPANLSHFIDAALLNQWGTYAIHVTSTDADNDRLNDEARTTNIYTFAIRREEYRVFVDFGTSTLQTPTNWNNIFQHWVPPGGQNIAGGVRSNLVTAAGEITTINLNITEPFVLTDPNSGGTTNPAVWLGYPPSATRDSWWGADATYPTGSPPQQVVMVLTNLQYGGPAHLLRFFASRVAATENRETEYLVEGSVTNYLYLDAANNTSNRVVSTPMWPRADGTIRITIKAGPNNTTEHNIFYLGVLDLQVTRDVVATGAIFGVNNIITDAQLRSGAFNVVKHIWSNTGMSHNASSPNFDLINPFGTEILTNQPFTSLSYLYDNRLIIASNQTHPGTAYEATFLGVYTSRFTGINITPREVNNMPWINALNPPGMTFTVIDDDLTAPSVGDTPLALMMGASAIAPTTNLTLLAAWNFNTGPERTLVSHGKGALTTNLNPNFAFESGATASTTLNAVPGDDAGFGARVSSTGNNGRWMQFTLDMTIYENLVMSFANRRTDTGHNSNTVAYSINGDAFVDFVTGWDPSLNAWAVQTFDFSSVSAMNGATNVRIRFTFGGATAAAGNVRFDNIQFTATPRSYFEITDRALTQVSATNPLYSALNVFDASGLFRGTSLPHSNMHVSIEGFLTNNVAGYQAAMSSADTTIPTSTSSWQIATSFSYSQIGDLFADGLSNRYVLANVPDADDDRPGDVTWLSNRLFGAIRIIDNDTNAPVVANVSVPNAAARPMLVLTNGGAPQSAEVIRGGQLRRDGSGSNTLFKVSDAELAQAGTIGLQLSFGARDLESGVSRGNSGGTNTVMSFSIGDILVGNYENFDAALSSAQTATNQTLSNIWSFANGDFTGSLINNLVTAGVQVVRVTIPDTDDDRPNDRATLVAAQVGRIQVIDDDIRGPVISRVDLPDIPGGSSILYTSFETDEGWPSSQASGSLWTNVITSGSATGIWYGTGYVNLNFPFDGVRKGGFTVDGVGQYFQLPPRADVSSLSLVARLSSGTNTRFLAVERRVNTTWVSHGTNAVTGEEYEYLSWTIDVAGVSTLRVVRVGTDGTPGIYIDALALTEQAEWVSTNHLHLAWAEAIDDYSGVDEYRLVAPAVNSAVPAATNAGIGLGVITNHTADLTGHQGVITGFVFAIDNDNDRPGDRSMGNLKPIIVRIDTNPPPAVANLRATDAAGGNVFDSAIDESSEIKIEWTPPGVSEAQAAGWRQSDSTPLSPWDTFIVTYYEVTGTNGTPVADAVTNTLTRESPGWTSTLNNWAFTNLVLSNLIFDTYYNITIQGRDLAGNIGVVTSVIGNTDRFIVTQGISRTHMDLFVRWTGPTNDHVSRDYDVLFVDSANGFHNALSNQWQFLAFTNRPSFLDAGGTNRLAPGLLTNHTYRFYRVARPGRWENHNPNRLASMEIYAAKAVPLYPGENWHSLFAFPDPATTNDVEGTVAYVFGTNVLPSAGTFDDATKISWFGTNHGGNARGSVVTAQVWLGTSGWNWQIGGSGSANQKRVPLGQGFLIELPLDAEPQSLIMIGRVPTQALVHAISSPAAAPTNPVYHVLSHQFPERIPLTSLGISTNVGFRGGMNIGQSDEIRILSNTPTNGVSQGSLVAPKARIWWRTSDNTWRNAMTGNTLANNYVIEPDDTIIIVHRRGVTITWTNRPVMYNPPTRNFAP